MWSSGEGREEEEGRWLTSKQTELDDQDWHDEAHGCPQHVLMVEAGDQDGGEDSHLVVHLAVE